MANSFAKVKPSLQISSLTKLTLPVLESYNFMTMYQERTYRNYVRTDDLVKFEVIVKETDLLVRAEKDLSLQTREAVLKYRSQIEAYIEKKPWFETALSPLPMDPYAPKIVQEMCWASQIAQVGPMASVAGAIAEWVTKDLLPFSKELIIENGGDIYLVSSRERTIGIYAGASPLSLKIGIFIPPEENPLGICTSSGTVGHSLSFGRADAVCILSKSAILADAVATAIGNWVQGKKDIESALERGSKLEGVLGIIVIVEEKMGVWGKVNLVPLDRP